MGHEKITGCFRKVDIANMQCRLILRRATKVSL